MKWQGVIPAMTTAFDESLEVDHAFMAKHANWLTQHRRGC
jgi:4-hydroxy-tetrahydrodipicolinate synthase